MGVSEKVAYLKGLMEGLKIDAESDNGKMFKAIIDVLDEVALEIEDLTDEVMEVGDGLDVISDDLADVEEMLYDDEDEDDDEPVYMTTCPECEEKIYFDEDYLEDGTVVCPNCGAKLEFDADAFDAEDGDRE
jgi:transcription initiation factor IIE alpha subunit